MSSSKDSYEKIVRFMKESDASLIPLKTRDIADGCGISAYAALYYLRKLNQRHIVEPDRNGEGGQFTGVWLISFYYLLPDLECAECMEVSVHLFAKINIM